MSFIETIIYMIWRGIAIGIIISAPMGPVGILCVQRTLEKGRRTGFFTGIGAAISDMFYCLLTGFGLSFIEEFLTRNHNIIQLLGSVVLIAFGYYLFRSNPTRNLRKPEESISDKRNILNGFLFTFSNPLIIFLIIGLFARFNFLVPEIRFYHYVIGFLSIGAGALLWWWVVTFLVAKLRSHFNLRSMWLINKIIGVIIFIFAIVGIVTAISAMASAATHSEGDTHLSPVYMNGKRGFNQFKHGTDSALTIAPRGDEPYTDMIPLASSPVIDISFRAANRHNASGKSYPVAETGKARRVKHPSWGIILKGRDGGSDTITVSTRDNPREENYEPTAVVFRHNHEKETALTDGFDFFTGTNAYRLSYNDGRCLLSGGNREYKPILSWQSDVEMPDSIGFIVSPGALLEVEEMSIEYPVPNIRGERTEYGNPDILETYLMRSRDPKEAIWGVFDRTLNEDMLRMGGDYRLAIVSDGEGGYSIIYLEGARTEASRWKPGMVKGRLLPTGFEGVYDVEWLDASGRLLKKDVKAQFAHPVLTINFPYHSSTIRLRRMKTQR